MSSTAELPVARPANGNRIVVRRTAHGYAVDYNDPNPETRYLPREQSLVSRLREVWRLAWLRPADFRVRRMP